MEFYLPEHRSDWLSIDCKENSNKSNDVSINLISCNFHIVDVIIDYAYENRADWADSVNNVKRKIELCPG